MHKQFKLSFLIFDSSVFSQSFILPVQQHNMITIVTLVNTTSQTTIDIVSSSISSRSLSQHNETWLIYNVHEIDFSFELDDLQDDEAKLSIYTKNFRFTTKFTKEKNQVCVLLIASYDEICTVWWNCNTEFSLWNLSVCNIYGNNNQGPSNKFFDLDRNLESTALIFSLNFIRDLIQIDFHKTNMSKWL